MRRILRRSVATPTPPVVQSHPSGISGLFWHQDILHTTQEVRRVTSSSPERASQLRRLATVASVDSNLSDNECIICHSGGEEDNDAGVALEIPTEACRHPPQVCIGCLQQVILAAINSGDFIVGILCPSYGCPHRLGYYDVQKWAAEEVFERYDKLLLQDSLRTSGSYIFCVAPNCSAGQEHTGGEDNVIVTCHHCGTKQCFRHQILWHKGLTCDQWDTQQREIADQHEQKTEEWIQAGTKACPGPGCGKRIQKSSGCDHMVCRRPGGCGHQFCWECLAPWLYIIEGDNSRHYDSCRYYTGLPGKNPAPTPMVAASTVRLPPQPETAPPIATPTPSPPPLPLLPIHDFPISHQWPESPWPPLGQPPSPPILLPDPPAVTNPVVPIRSPHLSVPEQSEPSRQGPIRPAWRTTEFSPRALPGPIPQNAIPGSSAGLSGLSRMTEISAQASIPPTTPNATPASSYPASSGSSRTPTIPITSAGAFTSYAPGYAHGYPYPWCMYPYGYPYPWCMYPYGPPPPMWIYPYWPLPPMFMYSSPFTYFDDSHGRREEDSSDT